MVLPLPRYVNLDTLLKLSVSASSSMKGDSDTSIEGSSHPEDEQYLEYTEGSKMPGP